MNVQEKEEPQRSWLGEPVLALNRHWQIAAFLPVRTAIENAMRDQASVMDVEHHYLMDFEEWMIHEPTQPRGWIKTATGRIAVPEVIVLKEYDERPPRDVSFKKINLAKRDDWKCQYCDTPLGDDEVTIDHVMPRSRGGENSWDNCVAACGRCNGIKADRTPREAGMKLLKQPTKPDWKAGIRLPRNAPLPSWRPFLEKERATA